MFSAGGLRETMVVSFVKKPRKTSTEPALLSAISGFVADDDGHPRLLNDRVRLGILSSLAVVNSLTFTELKILLDVSDGNLSSHARKLEIAGFIVCEKTFSGRIPKTVFSISSVGRRSLQRYLKHMAALINITAK